MKVQRQVLGNGDGDLLGLRLKAGRHDRSLVGPLRNRRDIQLAAVTRGPGELQAGLRVDQGDRGIRDRSAAGVSHGSGNTSRFSLAVSGE